MDHIIKIDTPAKVGFTSLKITNRSSARRVFAEDVAVSIACALCWTGTAKAALKAVLGGRCTRATDLKISMKEEGNRPIGSGIPELPEEADGVSVV
ncbi:MAG: hypothetical protein ACLVC1_05165 [Mediterraneibacter gnavus]